MFDISHFSSVFPSEGPKPYDSSGVRDIETHRKTLDNQLFIDRVLSALGLPQPSNEPKPYPPRGDSGLKLLHHQIASAKVSVHAKLSVLYYLLLDHDSVRANSNLADEFADASNLPSTYQLLMRGLWHLDRAQFDIAVQHLAHPSLPAEFSDDVLAVLLRHAPDLPTTTTTKDTPKQKDYHLALAYYHTARPHIHNPATFLLLFTALAQTSIPSALRFLRANAPEHARRQLFEKLVATVLEHPLAAGSKGMELAGLPLNTDEERWLDEYLTVGEGRRSRNARALAELRGLVTGKGNGASVGSASGIELQSSASASTPAKATATVSALGGGVRMGL
ncbi:hypothetical protein VTJ04DRAFT_7144 [Mycothermus thermophilus]|uniref:uncharacterized protein n=1 Tax=Humicola insolens TaxID=85995 RepID=UPI0037437060